MTPMILAMSSTCCCLCLLSKYTKRSTCFGIEADAKYYRFHNLQDNGVTPFTGNYPILERVSIDTATLTAFIDAEDIITTFGTDFDCLKITARIDKIQLDAPTTKAYKNSAYSSGYS